MISQVTIDSVNTAVNILDIVKPYVQLKRSGSNYKGKCPFHQGDGEAFTVSTERNMFKCFSCHAGGSAINFLMQHNNYSYPQAIKEIAKVYGIEVIEDSLTEEQENERVRKEVFYEIYDSARIHYHNNLFKPQNALILEYAVSRFGMQNIFEFQIGYAEDSWQDLHEFLSQNTQADKKLLVESKLISKSNNGRCFDFFRNRLMFPIMNASHRTISFGGRTFSKDPKTPKYINTSNSPIYNKSNSLYGINVALPAIRKSESVTFAEGYADVIALHSNSINNAVASTGTALTTDQIQLVSKYARAATLVYDGDQAGQAANASHADQLIQAGLICNVVTLPDNLDPDEFFNSQDSDLPTFKDLSEDYIIQRAKYFATESDNPMMRHDGIKSLAKLIYSYKEKSLRSTYVQQVSKILHCTKKEFQDEFIALDASQRGSSSSLEDDLPEGIDISSYEKFGFYAYNNEYYFKSDKAGRTKLSNFVMNPLFHVESANDTKRIYELINFRGHKIVCDFDMQEMVSITNFRRNIEGRGNFLFWGQESHMNKLKLKLYEETKTCTEVATLGWQKQGFFAWSNGIISNAGSFISVDNNGLVMFNGKNYFIPAFSRIYIDDKSIFIDERKFRYQDRDISLEQWSELFITVFGDNAKIGIAFWIATLFRDHLLHIFNNFPILNLFGPKGTGKSQMAMSLSCLFGKQQTPFNIHNGTKPGLAEHVQQFTNAFAWIDEYKNNIEYDKIETLKSIYDAIGRNRLNMDKGRKKETTLVNSAVILSGQEMPTADVALFSRMVFLQFHQTEYSKQESSNYDSLKAMEKEGLSHLSSQVLAHRKYFEDNFWENYHQVFNDLSTHFESHGIESRILRSFCTILAAYRTLYQKLALSLKYEDLRKIVIKAIVDQNSQISKSNEVSMFWEMVEAMFDSNTIIDRWHFKIDSCSELNLKTGKKILDPAINVLKLKYSSIYKEYATHSKRSGQSVLPNSTLKYYLENNPAFVGIERASKFTLSEFDPSQNKIVKKKQITTSYCFNYDMLDINLIRQIVPEDLDPISDPSGVNSNENDPF